MLAADLPRDKAIAAMVPEEKGFSKPFFGRHMIGKVDEQWVILSIVYHILSKLSTIFSCIWGGGNLRNSVTSPDSPDVELDEAKLADHEPFFAGFSSAIL